MEWSDMFPELLDTIAQKFVAFYEDYNYFGGVCKSWHSAAMEAALEHPYSNGPPSRFPCLMLSEEDNEFRELFLLSNKSICKIRLPGVRGKLCMSSFGWLVTVGEDHATQLINPLSRETIDLPKIDTFPEFAEVSSWDRGIWKLLFLNQSSSLAVAETMVVVIWGCSHNLGFCRIGDNKWTHVETGWDVVMYDITYYNGKVYCLDFIYHIRVCDIYGESYPKLIDKVSRLPKDIYNGDDVGYIVGMDDDDDKRKRLLVVIREGMYDDIEIDDALYMGTYKTKSFKVVEYDLENEKWSTVNDLGRKTLFVGYNSSFWVEDNTGVIEGNCIYYTDDVFQMYYDNQSGGGERDMGIYRMSDGTIEPHFTGVSRSELRPPIWLQSI